MLSANQIAGFFDRQYLEKESGDILVFLWSKSLREGSI